MADFDTTILKNNKDISKMSVKIKKHIRHGRHVSKYKFADDPTDVIDPVNQKYNGIDFINELHEYLNKMNLGEVEFSVFPYKPKSNIPACIANIKLGSISLASSFPEKYSLPEVAKQVAARKALSVLKKKYKHENVPITNDMAIVAKRLEEELQKKDNYAGLFCDKVEDIYKEEYNESLPPNWLAHLHQLQTNIMIEELPYLNKSILYYVSFAEKKKYKELIDTPIVEINNLPPMKFADKTERNVTVSSIDSNHMFWITFVDENKNDGYDTMFKFMNMPNEFKHFSKMYNIELLDIYAVQIENSWYRFQVTKIEDDNITGILIDLGIEWCVDKNCVMYLPEQFLKVPAQSISCALFSLFFAPYFQTAKDLFTKMLIGKQFTVVPENIECDIPLVTLYNGKCNINNLIMETIIEKTNFNKINESSSIFHLSYVGGYVYLNPPNETLVILESILDSISSSRPLNELYSKSSISPHKVYLVRCPNLNMWCRAIVEDFIFTDHKFKVFFIDYGSYGMIDEDKFIDLQSVDLLLAKISPQALKVSFNLFPPEKLTESKSRALYEMMIEKSLHVKVVSINCDGIQVVDVYDADEQNGNKVSFNTQLYQSV